jgi:ABC-type transport system involved in multi-copper enzyme maturation permease subunit
MFKTILFRQIKSLIRFPYLEIMLLILMFETSAYNAPWGISYVANLSVEEMKLPITSFAKEFWYENISYKVRALYPIIVFFSAILSYLIVSYFRDIGFLKTEFSLPVKRSHIYFSKFLASQITLSTIVMSSVLLSTIVNCLNIFQFLDPISVLFDITIILIETLLITFFTSSITILIAFMAKLPGVSLIASISLLYSFELISDNFRTIPLFPEGLRIFEDRVLRSHLGRINPYSLEPLLPSLIISFLAFLSGYYYVTRRLQVS